MKPNYFPGLQALRALAALLVLVGHVIAEAEHYFALTLPGDAIPWTRGVDIFFVISGFVITLSAARFSGQPVAFFWRRVLRVVPLYWVFTTLMVAALVLLPSGAKDTTFDPNQIISSYLFFPYERTDGRIAPVLSLGWTLNYEMFFYALAALCLALPRPFWALAGVMVGLAGLGAFVSFNSTALTFWTNPIILEFLFGVVLARAWQKGWRWSSCGASLGLLVLGFGLLVALDHTSLPRFLAAGLPAALMVCAGTLFCPPVRLPCLIWGDASYALYLSHRFTLRLATLLLLPVLPATGVGVSIFALTTCALAMAVGLLTHLAFERPLMRVLHAPRSGLPA